MQDPVAVTGTEAVHITFEAADIDGNGYLYLQNRGPAEVFVGGDSAVTSANGIGLDPKQTLNYQATVYDGRYSLWVRCAAR